MESAPEFTRSVQERFNGRPPVLALLAMCAWVIPQAAGWPFAIAALALVLLDVCRVAGNRDRLGELVGAVLTVGIPTALIAWGSRVLFERPDSTLSAIGPTGGELLMLLGYVLLPVGTLIQMGATRVEPPAREWKSRVAFVALCVAVSVVAVLVPQR